jgi:hypothetical protein
MAFANEEISREDYDKYDIDRFNDKFGFFSPNSDWTIDRERDIWFRLYLNMCDIENDGAEMWTSWGFYWKGFFIALDTKFLKQIPYSQNNGEYYVYAKILDIDIPQEAEQYKQEILKDLKEAFEASYAGIGIRINKERTKSCKIDLEYEGELV